MTVPSPIELELYGRRAHHVSETGTVGDHCVLEFAWIRDQIAETDVVRLRVAPWEREYVESVTAVFREAHIGRVTQISHDPEEIELPWEIVGFACENHGGGRWSFSLNCGHIRWTWSSKWPTIERDEST